MKVYLVETTMGNFTKIDKIFTTYRGASQYLIDEGFEPYDNWWFADVDLIFILSGEDNWFDTDARIVEMELEE